MQKIGANNNIIFHDMSQKKTHSQADLQNFRTCGNFLGATESETLKRKLNTIPNTDQGPTTPPHPGTHKGVSGSHWPEGPQSLTVFTDY
mmetsp:Transcript_122157/g.211942  ORF Transcript_122157/g.211942 Transcript_122157/m.211942 type:complete len:89 (+) Transcript_122157:204-470(+)